MSMEAGWRNEKAGRGHGLAVGRWLMVAPTLGGESRWFADGGGGTSMPGTLTFTTRRGAWWGLEVVRPQESP